jgi:branched-subunit amino acid transport protein
MQAIPKDRSGAPPGPERIFGSLPTTDLRAITIPGLTADLEAVHLAWHNDTLARTTPWWVEAMLWVAVFALGVVVWVTRRGARKDLRAK